MVNVVVMARLGIFEILYDQDGLKTGILMSQSRSFLVCSTLGVMVASYYTSAKSTFKTVAYNVFRFPTFLAFCLAILLNLIGYKNPAIVRDILQKLASPLSFMALVSIGVQVAFQKKYLYSKALIWGLGYKLLIAPIFIFLLYTLGFQHRNSAFVNCYFFDTFIIHFVVLKPMKKILSNLTFWVLTAITCGILLGHFRPDLALAQILAEPLKTKFLGQEFEIGATFSEMLGKTFISIVKLFINPIIFLTITLGIISMGDLKKVGKVGAKALLYFEIVTTFALIIGVLVANIIRPGDGVIAESIKGGDVSKYTQKAENFSWWKFLMDNSTLQVLCVAVLLGVFLSNYSGRQRIIDFLSPISKKIFWALHKIMLLAPIGAFGGMAFTIGKYGIKTIFPLIKLMGTVYTTMALFIFVVLWYVLRSYKINLWSYLKYIREELLIVLGTSSSEAALPSLMEKLEKMGCAKSVVGLVVPAGYSFNLDGTTIYLSMSVIFLSQVFNIHLTLSDMITIIGILMVTSKGAAGVTGSGFIVLASTLTAIKIIPVEGLALLLGVDRFMSEARAITNFIGNGVATIWLANNENEFDRSKMENAFTNVDKTEDIWMDNLNY